MDQENQIVRLVATDSKYHVAPYYVAPKKDPKSKKLDTGQDPKWQDLSEEARNLAENKPPLIIDGDTSLPASHLQEFNLGEPMDKIMYELFRRDDLIAMRKEDVNPGFHRFYFENKEEEAKVDISKFKLKQKAGRVISELSLEEMIDLGRLVGVYAQTLSSAQVEAAVMGKADDNPQAILDAYNDPKRKQKTFLRKLVDAGILRMEEARYIFGKETIGVDTEYAIMFLDDPNNKNLVSQWARQLKGEAVEATPSAPVEDPAPKQPEVTTEQPTASEEQPVSGDPKADEDTDVIAKENSEVETS